ncbi:MAG: 4Fe-4S dicluster domain-containing protein [Promethearchaeota archaeon]
MSDAGIEPTYIGKNKNLVFIVPKELFNMSLGPADVFDHESAKLFSKYIRGTFKGFQNSRKTKYGNENNTKTKVTPDFWSEFEKRAKELDIDFIGYTPVNDNYIFKDLKVYGRNAVILGMEIKWDKVKTAPSGICEIELFRVFKILGDITIQLTEYLKEQGYKSEAHHPFGGKLLDGPHVVAANLGVMGQNGLIITPEFGPRQRWSMITTDAEIPMTQERDFDELKEFCKGCGACVKNCKGGAIYEEPIKKNSGVITHIDRSKCIESLLNNNYCSYCLKICPVGLNK